MSSPPSPPSQSSSSTTTNQVNHSNRNQAFLLNHHPSINFNSNATPIPSFPRLASIQDLKSHQRQSEAFFLNNIASGASPGPFSPSKQQQTIPNSSSAFFAAPQDSDGPTTLRLIETSTRDQSYPALPYPDPDISLNIPSSKTPFVAAPVSTHSNRRISALPARATPAIGSVQSVLTKAPIENVEQLSGPENHTSIDPAIPNLASLSTQPSPSSITSNMSESVDKENRPIPRPMESSQPSSHKKEASQPSLQKPKASQSSLQKHYASPAAAISATVLQPLVIETPVVEQNGTTTTIDQVWAEMQTRAKLAPGIGKTLLPESMLNPIEDKPTDDNQDRFQETHLKTFSKFDSITNHYAAKRKVAATDVLPVASTSQKPTTSIPESNKRQKTNTLGYAKRLAESEKEGKEASKRRLELAKAKRKSQAATVAGTKGKLPPSGFSSFGTRLKTATKSVYKTVTGVLTNTINTSSPIKTKVQETSKSSRQTGVGFGVPSGLGIGPANPPKKVVPQRSVSMNQKNRLPPAGPTSVSNTLRSRQHLRSVSNSATIGSKRIISGGSTATEVGTLNKRGNLGSLATRSLRARTVSTTNKAIESKATTKPSMTAKPRIAKLAATGPSGVKAPITKLTPTLPNAPPKLRSPIKRTNPSTVQVTRSVIKPTVPQPWKPHTVKTITPKPVRSRPIPTKTTKPSAIPKPKYNASTRVGPSGLKNQIGVGKTVIRASVTLPVACKANRLLRSDAAKGEKKVVGGKRGLEEEEEEVEKPPSQKKIKKSDM
ncbi:hypothetical protein DFH28DRAFT_950042 [Melampsora americana]|nr:hypothetical protein DFH28DRAFT_950042 [Melampsora americana]